MKFEQSAKERLFKTAARLFYRFGYRAVGVDTLAAEAGIGKMTLYRHFPSKDDLIVAFLEQTDADFWQFFEQSIAEAPTAREKLLAFFAALQSYTTSSICYGCSFLNVATEYPSTDYPGHQLGLEHKQAILARFIALATEAGATQPEALANGLFLLMDGAYMASRMFESQPNSPAAHLFHSAKTLIEAHV